jgi:glucose/arabinose dehydrogenase
MKTRTAIAVLATASALAITVRAQDKPARDIDPDDVSVPDGYRIEAMASNLTVPTTAIFDGEDLIVAESGYNNAGQARLVRVRRSGPAEVIVSTGLNPPVTGLAMRGNTLYVSHAGKVSVVQGNSLKDILTDLPHGDHHNNKIVFGPDGKIYMGQGTMTNTGVVGIDNYLFGWLKEHPELHETPCRDITLTGENFESVNPLTGADDKVTTGAYKPFGTPSTPGEVIRGHVKCGGSIVRFNPDGSGFELVAWGLRNPFGVQFDGSGQLWTTNHGADVRGSRNVFNDPDSLVRVEQGAWYGFPDYFAGKPVTDSQFNAPEKPKPTMLWREHPQRSDAFVTFASHTGTNGLAFSPGGAFGYQGDAFIAAFGTFAPVTSGVNLNPAGFGVLRVDMKTREIHDFVKNDLPGPAYLNTKNGINRPSDVLFGSDGSLYIVDWGAATLDTSGLKLVPNTGVIWRVFKEGQAPLSTSGAIAVPRGGNAPEKIEPMVPNVKETYRMASTTLALLIGGLVVAIVAIVLAVKLLRRGARAS